MINFRYYYDLVVKLREAIQQAHDIRADALDFDGDRLGHYAALEEAEDKILDIAYQIFPDRYKDE